MSPALSLALLFLSACGAASPQPRELGPLPGDAATLDGVMRAFYEVVNVAPDEPRQWPRDRALYSPWIHFVANTSSPKVYDHASFVADTEPLIRRGFREREIHRTTRRYGNIAQIDSTYETRIGPEQTLSRGVNFLQLYFDGTRWWVTSVVWQTEDAEHPIPPEHLAP